MPGVLGQYPLEALVCSYPWPCEWALTVMQCESTADPGAYYNGNRGLFQIGAVHADRVGGDLAALYIPEVNVRVAYEIWSEQGWAPWACRP